MNNKQSEPLIFIHTATCMNQKNKERQQIKEVSLHHNEAIKERIAYLRSFKNHHIICEVISESCDYGEIVDANDEMLILAQVDQTRVSILIKKIEQINIMQIKAL